MTEKLLPAVVDLNVSGIIYSASLTSLQSEPGSLLSQWFDPKDCGKRLNRDSQVRPRSSSQTNKCLPNPFPFSECSPHRLVLAFTKCTLLLASSKQISPFPFLCFCSWSSFACSYALLLPLLPAILSPLFDCFVFAFCCASGCWLCIRRIYSVWNKYGISINLTETVIMLTCIECCKKDSLHSMHSHLVHTFYCLKQFLF